MENQSCLGRIMTTPNSPRDPAKLLRESSKNHKKRDFVVFLNTDKEQTTMSQRIQFVTILTCHILVDDSPVCACSAAPLEFLSLL